MSDRTTRWLDGQLPDELRSVLQSARGDDPSPAQLAKLRSGLETAVGEAAFASRAPSANSVTGEGGSATEPTVTAASAKIAPVAITIGAVVALVLAGLTLRNAAREDGSRSDSSSNDRSTSALEASDAPSTQLPAAVVAPASPAREAAAAVEKAPETSRSAPVQPAPSQRSLRATERAQATPRTDRAPHQPTLAEELASLDRIRAQLDSPPKALAAAARHAKKFANGALIPERELLELEALLREGRTAEARKRAKRMTSSEGFPYRAQVSQLLATY